MCGFLNQCKQGQKTSVFVENQSVFVKMIEGTGKF